MVNFIDELLSKGRDIFNDKKLYEYIETEPIDCSELPPPSTDGENLPEALKSKWFHPIHKLDKKDGNIKDFPALYIFEILQEEGANVPIENFLKLKNKNTGLRLVAHKNKIPVSKYLYVGMAQKDVGGRIVTHLGYNKRKGNHHGLHLSHWIRENSSGIELKVHVLRFDKRLAPYMIAFEKMVAKELNPVLGKH